MDTSYWTQSLLPKHGAFVKSLDLFLVTEPVGSSVSLSADTATHEGEFETRYEEDNEELYPQIIWHMSNFPEHHIFTHPPENVLIAPLVEAGAENEIDVYQINHLRQTHVSISSAIQMASHCPNIQQFSGRILCSSDELSDHQLARSRSEFLTLLSYLPNVRRLHLGPSDFKLAETHLEQISIGMPLLEYLFCRNFYTPTGNPITLSSLMRNLIELNHLKHLYLVAPRFQAGTSEYELGPSTVKTLVLVFFDIRHENLSLVEPRILNSFAPNLTSLDLHNYRFQPKTEVGKLMIDFDLPSLSNLSLDRVRGKGFLQMFQNCKNLRRLRWHDLTLHPFKDAVDLICKSTWPHLLLFRISGTQVKFPSTDHNQRLETYCKVVGIKLEIQIQKS